MKDETRSECQILLYYSNILFKKALHKLLLSSNRELCANIVYSVMPKRPLLSHLCYIKKKKNSDRLVTSPQHIAQWMDMQ